MEKAVVLLSGKLSSAVAMVSIIDLNIEVYPLIFDYGKGNNDFQIARALDLCEYYNIPEDRIKALPITKDIFNDDFLGVQLTIINMAFAYAVKVGAKTIVHGLTLDDDSSYISAVYALSGYYGVGLNTPLVAFDTASVKELASTLGVPVNLLA